LAAERSSPNDSNCCSRSAETKHCFAAWSSSSFPVAAGGRARVAFTLARCAHPQQAKIAATAKTVWIRRSLLSAEWRDSNKTRGVIEIDFRGYFFLKPLKAKISDNLGFSRVSRFERSSERRRSADDHASAGRG
jgi:hypothetical protein